MANLENNQESRNIIALVGDDATCEYDFSCLLKNSVEREMPKANKENGTDKDAGIFLVLSLYNKNSIGKVADYEVADDTGTEKDQGQNKRCYRGEQTNDAPIQYLIDEVYDSGYNLRKIVCINTPEVEENLEGGINSYTRFKELVKEYTSKVWGKTVEIDSIQYSVKEDDDKTYYDFYRQLNAQAEGIDSFFVDYTGGFRDTSFLMVAAIRFLEFKGKKCEKVIYSDFHCNPKKLKTLNKAYDIFQMISGMNEFAYYGTTRQLSDDSLFKNKNRLIKAIQNFSHATNVGDLANLDNHIKELNDALIDSEDCRDLKSVMISSMSDVITKKIFGEDQEYPLISNDGEINYLRLIDWCIENKMYQQAAVLYIEKVPIVYWRNGIINDLLPLSEKPAMGSSREAATFYSDLPNVLIYGREMIDFYRSLSKVHVPSKKDWNISTFMNILDTDLKEYPAACKRFRELIRKIYSNYGKEGEIPEGVWGIADGTPKDISKFMHYISEGGLKPIHYYFMYGDHTRIPTTYNKLQDKARTNNQIQWIYKNSEINPKTNDDKGLCTLMAFYLAIKLLRNKMSHAIENQDEDEEQVIQNLEKFLSGALKDESIKITLDECGIRHLLSSAMTYAKKAEKFTVFDALQSPSGGRKPVSEHSKTIIESNTEEKAAEKQRIAEILSEINGINIKSISADVTEEFERYLKIVIYVLSKIKNNSGTLNEIKEQVPEGIKLPEKRTLSKEGKKSGIKLISEYCEDIIKVDGTGENARLTYLGNVTK